MYRYLRGTVAEKTATSVVLDVNGIGFELLIPMSTTSKVPAVGKEAKLLTYFVVREDAQLLFGFATEEELAFFKLLTSISGIGPKMGLTAMSGLGLAELKRAIVQGSIPALTSISGIGKKTAERIVVELREKIAIEGIHKEESVVAALDKGDALMEDSIQALISLGYARQNAKTAIQKALTSGKRQSWNAENLIRESLKYV